MIGEMPKFYDSPYFVDEPGNWHLKPGAPEDIISEFNSYMNDGLNEKTSKSFNDILGI